MRDHMAVVIAMLQRIDGAASGRVDEVRAVHSKQGALVQRVYELGKDVSDPPENVMLVYLRRLDARTDRLIEDVADLKSRTTGLEFQIGHVMSTKASYYEGISMRLDRAYHLTDSMTDVKGRVHAS